MIMELKEQTPPEFAPNDRLNEIKVNLQKIELLKKDIQLLDLSCKVLLMDLYIDLKLNKQDNINIDTGLITRAPKESPPTQGENEIAQ